MEKSFIFEYLDENNFKKRERSVRKYNMLAYKKLTFEYYPTIRSGKFLGKKISEDKTAKTESYELKLPTDESFAKVHGEIIEFLHLNRCNSYSKPPYTIKLYQKLENLYMHLTLFCDF